MDLICKICFFSLLSFFSTSWLYPKILKIALLKNITDNPNVRKLQKRPIPVIGGIVVIWGILSSFLFYAIIVEFAVPATLILAMVIMLYIGTIDDVITLTPSIRFLIEAIVVLLIILTEDCGIDNFYGLWGYTIIPTWLSYVITIIACIGLINAINMIDGVDGLSSGFCIIAFSIIGSVMCMKGDYFNSILAFTTVGSLILFFIHNVFGEKSKMFIGDGGTLVIGIIASWLLMFMFDESSNPTNIAEENFGLIPCALAIYTIPVFDTLKVMIVRIIKGKSPFSPDRTHLHHLFIDYGFSHIGTTSTIVGLQILIFTIWWITYKLGGSMELQLYIVATLGLIIDILYVIAREIERRHTSLHIRLMNRKRTNTRLFMGLRKFVDGNY